MLYTGYPAFEYPFKSASECKALRKRKGGPIHAGFGKELGLEENFANFQLDLKRKCVDHYERRITDLNNCLVTATKAWKECLEKLKSLMVEVEALSEMLESQKRQYFELIRQPLSAVPITPIDLSVASSNTSVSSVASNASSISTTTITVVSVNPSVSSSSGFTGPSMSVASLTVPIVSVSEFPVSVPVTNPSDFHPISFRSVHGSSDPVISSTSNVSYDLIRNCLMSDSDPCPVNPDSISETNGLLDELHSQLDQEMPLALDTLNTPPTGLGYP